ncbi:MAG: LacI family transcriptional regulator [bacterium]|nr:LacI family transcriptional regulator [bacterium]
MGKVTLKDIAALLNTSPKTVSKALNNQPGVSKELRQKIEQTARKLHYIPNPFGKGLSGKPLKTIGIIVPDNVNPSYSLMLRGMETKAAALDYSIILCNSSEDVEQEKALLQVLLGKHVDGVIICPAFYPGSNPNIKTLQSFKMPYVLLNRAIHDQRHPCVKTDNFLAAYLAGQYLIRKGHSEIVHLTRQYSVPAVEERLHGLQKAFRENALPFHKQNVYRRCDVSIESAYRTMKEILAERRDFSAVLAFNDIIAFGVMKAIHEARLSIPGDLAVMGFDNLIFSEICLVPLTTMNQSLCAIGTAAMELLLEQIEGERDVRVSVLPDPYVVERQSV